MDLTARSMHNASVQGTRAGTMCSSALQSSCSVSQFELVFMSDRQCIVLFRRGPCYSGSL